MILTATLSERAIRMGILHVTSIDRKSRMPQIPGIKGEAVVLLLRTLDNNEDEVSWAFLEGQQNGSSFICFISCGL